MSFASKFWTCVLFLLSQIFLDSRTLNHYNATFYQSKTNSCGKSPFLKQLEQTMISGSFLTSFWYHFSCSSVSDFWMIFSDCMFQVVKDFAPKTGTRVCVFWQSFLILGNLRQSLAISSNLHRSSTIFNVNLQYLGMVDNLGILGLFGDLYWIFGVLWKSLAIFKDIWWSLVFFGGLWQDLAIIEISEHFWKSIKITGNVLKSGVLELGSSITRFTGLIP